MPFWILCSSTFSPLDNDVYNSEFCHWWYVTIAIPLLHRRYTAICGGEADAEEVGYLDMACVHSNWNRVSGMLHQHERFNNFTLSTPTQVCYSFVVQLSKHIRSTINDHLNWRIPKMKTTFKSFLVYPFLTYSSGSIKKKRINKC
jgi:hypothetical protein